MSRQSRTGRYDYVKKWADIGLIEIRAAEELKNEFEQANPNAKLKLEEQYLKIPQSFIEDPATFGEGSFGNCSFGGSGTTRDGHNMDYYFQEFCNVMFPDYITLASEKQRNAYYDVMHIATHYIYERDIFLARDNHFLNKVDEMQKKFSDLIVLRPSDCVSLLNQILQIKR